MFCCLRPNPAPLDGGVVHCQSSDPARANARGIRNRTSLAQHVRACNPGVSSVRGARSGSLPRNGGVPVGLEARRTPGASGAFPRCSVCSRRRRWPRHAGRSGRGRVAARRPRRCGRAGRGCARRSASGQDTPRGARRAGGIGRVEVPSATEAARSARRRRTGQPGEPCGTDRARSARPSGHDGGEVVRPGQNSSGTGGTNQGGKTATRGPVTRCCASSDLTCCRTRSFGTPITATDENGTRGRRAARARACPGR